MVFVKTVNDFLLITRLIAMMSKPHYFAHWKKGGAMVQPAKHGHGFVAGRGVGGMF